MNKYYQVQATINGDTDTLYGSFLKSDCQDEIDSERDSWKDDGYKAIKIISTPTSDKPCPTIYTKTELLIINKGSK